jgi:hypothetical protein
MHPDTATAAIKNVSKYSILNSLRKILGEGDYQFDRPLKCKALDGSDRPPDKFTDTLIQNYADCIMGKDFTSEWVDKTGTYPLNFGRPSIRLSGGEFYTWPHRLNGKRTPEDERLFYQRKLLVDIRRYLPEYDIWILTNGRFAESIEKAEKIVSHWAAADANTADEGGRTRICVSVDAFHRPPKNSTIEQMLWRLWEATKNNRLGAPYIYSITNKKIFLVGRALKNFKKGKMPGGMIQNASCSTLNECDYIVGDPLNLAETNGCDELKGFCCPTPKGVVLANNIVINYNGHLAYCCVCVGDYGDFIHAPKKALKQMVRDPVSLMLRNGESATEFLKLAAELDPSIKVFGNSKYDKTSGSTCYQILSGERIFNEENERKNEFTSKWR